MSPQWVKNPHLAGFAPLLGAWTTSGTHPYLPGRRLRAHVVFESIEGEAFVRMRSVSEDHEVPSTVALFGTDDAEGEGFLLTFDTRGVSRRYRFSCRDGELVWWRDDPSFRQRFTLRVQPDGQRATGRGEMSRDGAPWEPDLALEYERTEAPPPAP